jgi:ubiquinone/menaquinone biosynthesis C-methylase UbiE
MKTDYNAASLTYDNTRNASYPVIDMMKARIAFDPNINVLDFGCGTGNYLYQLSSACKCSVYGLEPSDGMRNKAIDKNRNIRILRGDHENIPYADDFFDFIYMTDVIHHVPDLAALFGNLYRKMKNGACVCILTESHEQIESRWYNEYFPSLIPNEKKRYPDIGAIIESAESQNLVFFVLDTLDHGSEHAVTEDFVKMVEEKNYSMFRNLDEEEYQAGLARLRNDVGRVIRDRNHGESLLWLKKEVRPASATA